MSETLIKVEGVSKKFCRSLKKSLWYGMQDLGREITGRHHGGNGELRPDEFWAIKDVSFELKRGECLGLIGRNGAGKTTLLKMLNGLIKPDSGRIEINGKIGAIIALGAGFNPILTGRENIYVNSSVHGLTKSQTDEYIEEIIEFSELREFIDMPVQSYSSGMTIRLGFSIATTIKPDVLILDEVLAVGDASFKAKCWERLGRIIQDCAVIVVSHETHSLSRLCNYGIYLKNGSILYSGKINEALKEYQNKTKTETNNFTRFSKPLIAGSLVINKTLNIETQDLELKLTLESLEKISPKAISISLVDENDSTHAKCKINEDVSINIGTNAYNIKIKDLKLSTGKYYINMIICGINGADFIFYSRKTESFEILTDIIDYDCRYFPDAVISSPS